MFKFKNLFACALIGIASAWGSASSAEPLKIRGAWVVPVTNIGTMFLANPDILKHSGKSYVFEPTRYAGTPLMVTAMVTGDLDVGLFAYQSLHLALNAGMGDIKIIAEELRDGVPGYFSNQFVVRADSGINTPAGLKGKVIATNAIGSGADVAMRAGLRKAGLDDKKDVNIIEAAFPTMKALLLEKKADMVTAVLPFSEDPELKKIGKVLYTEGDAIGPNTLGLWVVRGEYLKKHRAALVDFMEDYLRVMRFYTDPANHQKVVEIAAKLTKRPPAAFDWAFTKKDYYRDPQGHVDVAALQSNIDTTHRLGFLPASFDVKKYVDMSLLNEASKRIGK